MELVKERCVNTLGTRPVSVQGATADVASATDNACCRDVWMLRRRERWSGRDVARACFEGDLGLVELCLTSRLGLEERISSYSKRGGNYLLCS